MVVTLKQILSENKDVILKNKKLYCHSCEITINCKTKHQTTRLSNHLKSKTHGDNKKFKKKKNAFIDETLENNKTKNLFNFELTKALLQSGVGLNIVNSPPEPSFDLLWPLALIFFGAPISKFKDKLPYTSPGQLFMFMNA
jgi:hypothetical protein